MVLRPTIIWATKAQKKASRVADMLALKELEDYRHYVDFSEVKDDVQKTGNLLNQLKSQGLNVNNFIYPVKKYFFELL